MKKKQQENYLDYVPVRAEKYQVVIQDLSKESLLGVSYGAFYVDQEQNVTLLMEHRGMMHFMAQKLFHKPRISQIHLEEFGSFVWQTIDGKKDVYQIGQEVKAHFGDKAEPLYERLCPYIQSLEANGFICYKK